MLQKIILLVALLGLSACAFDKDTSKANAKEVAERERQLQTYSKVTGLYRGTLTTGEAQQSVELRLFTLENEAGKNSNGDERYSVVLRGNYRKMNPVGPGYNFKARYIPETAELIFTNDAALGADDIHTINAKLAGQKIVGEVKSLSGIIGVLDLSLSSTEARTPGNSENEYNESLFRQYAKIAGVYKGDNVVDGKVNFTVTLTLQVIFDKKVPMLIGKFHRDDDTSGIIDMNLTTAYQPDLVPAILSMTGTLVVPGNVPYSASFYGTIENDTYTGSWRSNTRGFQGDFVLKKVK